MPGHSRSKNGVALLAYDPGIHRFAKEMDRRVKPGDDDSDEFDACSFGVFRTRVPSPDFTRVSMVLPSR
jgi:hypothetical protein